MKVWEHVSWRIDPLDTVYGNKSQWLGSTLAENSEEKAASGVVTWAAAVRHIATYQSGISHATRTRRARGPRVIFVCYLSIVDRGTCGSPILCDPNARSERKKRVEELNVVGKSLLDGT